MGTALGWFRSLRHEVPPPETRLDLGPAHYQAALLPKSPREPPPARLPFSLPALSLYLHPDGSVHQPSPPSPGAALCPIHWTKAAGAKPVRPMFPTESSLNPFSRVPRLFLTNVHVSSIECSLLSPTPTRLANCLSHACGCLPNLPLIHTSYRSLDLWAACLGSVCHILPSQRCAGASWSRLSKPVAQSAFRLQQCVTLCWHLRTGHSVSLHIPDTGEWYKLGL